MVVPDPGTPFDNVHFTSLMAEKQKLSSIYEKDEGAVEERQAHSITNVGGSADGAQSKTHAILVAASSDC